MPGSHGVKGIYSTKEGLDLADVQGLLLPPKAEDVNTNQGDVLHRPPDAAISVSERKQSALGWGVFGEIGFSDGNPNPLDWAGYIGIGGSSFIPGRENDRFGIAYFYYGISDELEDGLELVTDLDDESGVEMIYNLAATPWFRITGDLQFIDPGRGAFGDDVLAGVNTSVRF